jgi:hypothetical protein
MLKRYLFEIRNEKDKEVKRDRDDLGLTARELLNTSDEIDNGAGEVANIDTDENSVEIEHERTFKEIKQLIIAEQISIKSI